MSASCTPQRAVVLIAIHDHDFLHRARLCSLAGVVVVLVLRFITKVFERVPYNAMGAIVLASVLNLLDVREAIFLFKANIPDFLVWMAAFLGTIFLGVEIGLGIAVGLAIILVIYQSAAPHTAVLGRLPNTGVFLGEPWPVILS
jgi:sulfate transporter 4